MSSVQIKELLTAGVHFGHQTKRWNPKMCDYILESRSKTHIIDLRQTSRCLNKALEFIREKVAEGKDVLFIGTKKQCRDLLKETAERLEMHYVVDRWLGGALTNFQTIRSSIKRLEELEAIRLQDATEGRSKKEVASLRREEQKLHRNLDGIRKMAELPAVIVVIDIQREQNAVKEGRKLGIPIVALVDTNCDPTLVEFPIPGNDDGIRSTKLIISKVEVAVAAGLCRRKTSRPAKKADEEKDRPAAKAKKEKVAEPEKAAPAEKKKPKKPAEGKDPAKDKPEKKVEGGDPGKDKEKAAPAEKEEPGTEEDAK